MIDSRTRNPKLEEYYMRQALKVAEAALEIGEVPVGCVIVYRYPPEAIAPSSNKIHGELSYDIDPVRSAFLSSGSVIVSHGANQVNATRDATRHAEIVSIDRMLTGSLASDQVRLSQDVIAKAAHGHVPIDNPLKKSKSIFEDKWINVEANPSHWKNTYGWGSGRIFQQDIFKMCDLYVTVEPCIMCAAALAKVGINRVYFGCKNDRFGGCGSLMNLHDPSKQSSSKSAGYSVVSGILETEAISLLRSFYNRENFHAPDEKRRKKPPCSFNCDSSS